jgi:3-methyladenine DNA glycosylase/8-oxoguanine DNA glycosylase
LNSPEVDAETVAPNERTRVELDGPVDLLRTLTFGRMGMGDPCLRVSGGAVWRTSRTPLGAATQRLRLASADSVEVDVWGPGGSWFLEHASALCGAFDHPETFRPSEPLLLRHLSRGHPGLRIGRTEAVFETALFVTLEQRVVTREAWGSWRLMVRALGERAPGPLPDLWVPPAPERIASTPYEVFHRFGVERRRADVLKRLGVVARRLEETAGMSLEAAYSRLRAVIGIGPWTAARIAMLALGDSDAVFVGDLHLPHLVSSALAGERRGSDERMLELLEPFRGHRARVVRLLMAGARTREAM